MLPDDRILREKMIDSLIKKNIKTHFIFENIIANSKVNYNNVLKNYKLNKLINIKK